VVGGRQPCPIARDRRLRAECVHALSAADARQQVETEHGRLLGGHGPERFLGLADLEETQDRDAFGQALGLIGTRRIHPYDKAGAGQRRRCVGGDGGTRLLERLVRELSRHAGTSLDADLPARADQFLDHIGHEANSALSATGLRGDRQFHGRSV